MQQVLQRPVGDKRKLGVARAIGNACSWSLTNRAPKYVWPLAGQSHFAFPMSLALGNSKSISQRASRSTVEIFRSSLGSHPRAPTYPRESRRAVCKGTPMTRTIGGSGRHRLQLREFRLFQLALWRHAGALQQAYGPIFPPLMERGVSSSSPGAFRVYSCRKKIPGNFRRFLKSQWVRNIA
jgi:hypothetical protein